MTTVYGKCPHCGRTALLAMTLEWLGGRGYVATAQCYDLDTCWETYDRLHTTSKPRVA